MEKKILNKGNQTKQKEKQALSINLLKNNRCMWLWLCDEEK